MSELPPEEFEHEVDLENELAPEPEPATEPEPRVDWQSEPAAPPQFNYNDRLYALGFSNSGKSEILNLLFSGIRCQKVLIDTKPEFAIDDVEPAHVPEGIDWGAPIIHYKPLPGSDSSQYEPIFERALTVPGPLLVCVHELQDLVDYRPQRAGRFLLGYASKGSRLGKGLLVGTQRPRLAPVSALSEANHVIVLPPRLARDDDMAAAAEQLSPVQGQPLNARDLERELAALEAPYSFLWRHRQDPAQQLIALPPIPDDLRRLSIVRRLEDA